MDLTHRFALATFATSIFALLCACPPAPKVPEGPPPEYEEPDSGAPPRAHPSDDTRMSPNAATPSPANDGAAPAP